MLCGRGCANPPHDSICAFFVLFSLLGQGVELQIQCGTPQRETRYLVGFGSRGAPLKYLYYE